ncbi:MAG: hypothetical protein ACK5RV_09635 [Flavobacterium sp.]|jgi:hypothetical protein|uniref:hypothetical protein n=1 Tax=Flavobacterium sp. TaxID=239 RepID=UPI0022BF00DD|nr:hypothetical protein [Flavobacterium sp.]MCZ8169715.1 hypothetical protein [Flavobacterium sp.]MCZ8298413.1 hypothetical protein [Flavobacterium sp.]
MNIRKLLFVFTILVTGQIFGQAFNVTYPFTSVTTATGTTDPTAVPTAAGVTFGSFVSVGASVNPNATTRFSFTGFDTGAVNGSDTFTGSINTSKYYEVTITPQSGFQIDINSITFTLQRSGTGIRQYAVRSSLDYTTNLPASISPANANLSVVATNVFQVVDASTGANTGSLVTLGAAYDAITSPITFRFYGWNAEAAGGTFSIDNVIIDGVASPNCTPPTAPTGSITGTTPACTSTTLTFTDTATAPVVNYWQTTPTGTSTANNAATPLNVTTSGTYYVRAFNSATSCWSTGNVTSSVITIVPAVNITTQPVNQSIASAQNTSFSVVATSATAYQWQVSTDNGVTWANLTNTPPYSTVTTATMNITNATFGMNGYRYRCIVSGTAPCGAVNSNAGILSVVNAINTLANLGTQVTAAFVPQATLDHVLFKFQVSPTVTTNLQGIANVVTAGTYISADVLNLKVRYSADNVLDITDATLSTLATPGVAGTKTFPAFATQSIIGGTTGYIFITADISATAIIGNTISLNAVTTANLIFSLGIKTGSTTNGGTQTIAPSAPNLPATFTRGCSSNTTQVLNWSAPLTGPFDGYIIVVRQGGLNPHAVTSLVASSQPFNTDFSLAPTFGSTAPLSRVVYIGTGTTATITGLTAGATYVYEIYTYRNNGPTNTVFSITPRSLTQVAALSNVNNAIATPGNTTGLIGWANPNALCFDQVLVLVTAAPGITFAPTGDGSAYTANPAFAAFNQVVYASSGNNVNITGLTNGVTYYIEIFVRSGTDWSSGVEVALTPLNIVPTVLKTGDLLLIAYDNTTTGADDAIRLLSLVEINPGTSFIWANTTYETGGMPAANVRTDKWYRCTAAPDGNLPFLEFTYTGTTPIPAASVFCINTVSAGTGSTISVVDATGTTYNSFTISGRNADGTTLTSHGSVNVSSSAPDSMFLLQGFFTYDITGSTFTGTVLSGVQDGGVWYELTDNLTAISGDNFRRSRKHPQLICASLQANTTTGAYEVSYNTSSTTFTTGSRSYLIGSILNYTTNWTTSLGTCPTNSPFIITVADPFNRWTGALNTNWFDCNNWALLTVPDELTDVVIDATAGNDAVIDYTATNSDTFSDVAKCKDLTISGRRVQLQGNALNRLEVYGNLSLSGTGILDMDDSNSSTVDGNFILYGNWTNAATAAQFQEGNGTVHFVGSAPQIINGNVHTNVEQFYNVVLDNDFNTNISNNLFAQENLEVKLNKILTIGADDYVFAFNTLTLDGILNINNTGQLIQIHETDTNNGDYSGTKFRMDRTTLARNFDYVYWSAPTENVAVNSLPNALRYEWNPIFANSNGTYGNWAIASGTMVRGKGYIARASNGSATAVPLTATFTGKPHNGQFTTPISRGNYDGPDFDADLTNSDNFDTTRFDDNWNLVGNPYPSAIDAEEFLVLNQTKIEGSIWVWKHGLAPTSTTSPFYNNFQYNYWTSDYIKYNGLGSTEPDSFAGKIGAGQGFMVNMLHSATTPNTLTFENSLRADALLMPHDNTDFYRNAQWFSQQKHRIWLDIVNTTNGNSERTLVGYASQATNGRDHLYDCIHKITGELSIYSLLQDEPYSIQGKGLPFTGNDRIPLGVYVNTAGTYAIALYKTDGLFAGQQPIYLEDKVAGLFHNLKNSPYTVTLPKGELNTRFVLRYSIPGIPALNLDSVAYEATIKVVAQQRVITVQAEEPIQEVMVYDLQGRLLTHLTAVHDLKAQTSPIEGEQQTLIVKIILETGAVMTQKVVL